MFSNNKAISSRSSKIHRNGVIAPMSIADVVKAKK